ncbi:unnamed protein product [Amoebophrya sp. A120]|nr:unnamed protein product [Amoebophrya sp. A120]|eukprot:GSA120T00023898001.1
MQLAHTSHISWIMQNVHDKSSNLPDPDIFPLDIPSRSTNLSSTAATGTRPSTLSSGAGIYQNPPPPSGASTAAAQIAVPQGSVEAATAAQAASRGKQAFSYDVGSMYLTLGILPTDSLISELEQFGVTQKNSSDSGVERSRDHVDARLDPNRFSQLTGKKLSAKEKFRRMFKSMAVSHADKLRKELFRLDLCLHRLTEMDEEAGESGLERWKSFLMGHKQLLDASGAASAPPAGANVSAPSSQLSINPRAQNEGGPPSNADSGMTHTSSTLQPLSSDQSRSSKNSNALRRRPADMSKLASSRLVPTATTSTNTGGNLTLNTMSTTSAGAGLNKMKNGGGVGGAPIFPATSSGTTSGANMIQEQYMKAKFEQMMEQQQQRSDLQISSQALRAGPATTSGASSSSASKELGPAMVMSPRGGGGPDGGGKGNDTPTATATAPPVSAALERIKRQSKSAPPGLDPGMMGLPVGGDSGSGDVAASPRDGGSSSSFMSQQLQQQFGFSTPTGMDDEGDNSDYFDVTGQHTPREQQEQHSMQQAQFGSPFFGPPPGGPGFDPNFDPAYYQQMMAAHHAHMQHMMQLYAANQQSAMSGDTSTTGVSYSFQPQPGAMQLPPPGAGGPPNPGDPNQYAAYLAAQQAYMVAMAGTTAGGANANINRNSGGKNRSSGPSASSTASGGQQIKTSSRRSQKNNKVQITASDSEKQSAEQQPTGAKGGAVGGGGKKQNK